MTKSCTLIGEMSLHFRLRNVPEVFIGSAQEEWTRMHDLVVAARCESSHPLKPILDHFPPFMMNTFLACTVSPSFCRDQQLDMDVPLVTSTEAAIFTTIRSISRNPGWDQLVSSQAGRNFHLLQMSSRSPPQPGPGCKTQVI